MRDLGVVFDQYLIFQDHISGIYKSTHFHLCGIGRIRNILNFDATAQLIYVLITTRLDCCNSILYNLPNKQIERLQRIQNQAARMLKRIPRRNPRFERVALVKNSRHNYFLNFAFDTQGS